MKVCILGDGLTSLALAKALVNRGISTDIFLNRNHKKKHTSRSLGISKSNVEFFNKNIINIDNLLWNINKIEIYSESLDNSKIIEFKKNNRTLFSTIKNHELIAYLKVQLKKSKYFKLKDNLNDYKSIIKNYSLIINCELNNEISMYHLGRYYQYIEKNYYEMKKYYLMSIKTKKAFININPSSKYSLQCIESNLSINHTLNSLGCYYLEIEKNYEKMKYYFFEAYKLLNFESLYNLGVYYQFIEKNYEEMKKYYFRAIQIGNKKERHKFWKKK